MRPGNHRILGDAVTHHNIGREKIIEGGLLDPAILKFLRL